MGQRILFFFIPKKVAAKREESKEASVSLRVIMTTRHHVVQRRVSSNVVSLAVLPSTNHDMTSGAPTRPRRRRLGFIFSLSANDGNFVGRRRAVIKAVTILSLAWIILFGLNSISPRNFTRHDEKIDSSIISINQLRLRQTSLPLSNFSDLTYALENSDLVALYFAASWCPMSTPISILLDSTFGKHYDMVLTPNGERKTLSIVYVSSDKTIDEFNAYIHDRNWLFVPYESAERDLIKRHFSTCAERESDSLGIDRMHEIPTIIVIDSATHGVLTFNGVHDVESMREESLGHWKDIQDWIRKAKVT